MDNRINKLREEGYSAEIKTLTEKYNENFKNNRKRLEELQPNVQH